MALVSIIIPCHNAEKYVGAAIESALGQTHVEVEIIVIDDASTDGSREIVRELGDKVKLISFETNRGACAARNAGIERARGEFLQFLDADDYLLPEKIELQLYEFRQHGSSVDAVYCDWESVDVRTGERGPRSKVGDPQDPVTFILGGTLITGASLYRAATVRKVNGFRGGVVACQEFDLHLRMAIAGAKFRRLPQTLFVHRLVPGSISGNAVRAVHAKREIVEHSLREMERMNRLSEERVRAAAGIIATGARKLLEKGRKVEAVEFFELAKEIHPDGGMDAAYQPLTRFMSRALGPELTERLVGVKRKGFQW